MAHEEHGSSHGHDSNSKESKGEGSGLEKLPLFGRAIKMLKAIVSVEGLKNFLEKMAEDHVLPVILKVQDVIGEFFGMKGGGGGGGHAAHAH